MDKREYLDKAKRFAIALILLAGAVFIILTAILIYIAGLKWALYQLEII